MVLSYRVTAVGVVAAYAGLILVSNLPAEGPFKGNHGDIAFNPCMMWEQLSATFRISSLSGAATLLVLVVQGLRNRSVSGWIAAVCLLAQVMLLQHELWRMQHCYSTRDVMAYVVLKSFILVMCIHQMIPVKWFNQAAGPSAAG